MENTNNIIIKKYKKHKGHAHHGGGWKVAYADFVTAMMVLFLLLWIINSIEPVKLAQMGNYFSPTVFKEVSGIAEESEKSKKDVDKEEEEERQSLQVKIIKKLGRAIKGDANKNIDITNDENGVTVIIKSTENLPLFTSRSSVINKDTKDIIYNIAKTIKDLPYYLSVTGHTSGKELGRVDRNNDDWSLAGRRATVIMRELVKDGIDEDRFASIVSKGDFHPHNIHFPSSITNRRVEITILTSSNSVSKHKKNYIGLN
ncbi:MAG: flagellar motor protein MotB [Anaplasmataceae bacterium]|nr:flagellar motor protein MotB [Anaplasmataceae bacterium]